jgi:hypothetical protein
MEQPRNPLDELSYVGALAPAKPRSIAGTIGLPVYHAGVKNDRDIRPPTGSTHVFILLHDSIGPFVPHDQQEGVRLQVLYLEFEPTAIVGLCLHGNGTADLDDRIHRATSSPYGRNRTGDLRRPAAFELIVECNREGDNGCYRRKYDLRLAEECDYLIFVNHKCGGRTQDIEPTPFMAIDKHP